MMTSLRITFRLALLLLQVVAYGQATTGFSPGMTSERNDAWLSALKHVDKNQQWTLIKDRFFSQQAISGADTLDIPVLVIDGISMDYDIDDQKRHFLSKELTADKIEIQVFDKEPEGLYVNKRFTGIVLIVINDQGIRRKFKRMNRRK